MNNIITNNVLHNNNELLRTKLMEFAAKYWYDTEYQYINKNDHKKAIKSRKKFNIWIKKNIELFIK